MAEAMEPLGSGAGVPAVDGPGAAPPRLGLLAGLGMTLAVQRSSATIAVLQRAAARPGPDGGCLLGLAGAIPVLLGGQHRHHRHGGAGIGGGQSRDAKRLAVAHTLFNLSGAAVCWLLLPQFTALVGWSRPPRAGRRRAGPADRQRPHPVQSGLHGAVAAPDPSWCASCAFFCRKSTPP